MVIYAASHRYEVQVHEGVLLRVDHWTGHVDATLSLKDAPWVTLVTKPKVGTATFEDIKSIEPPPAPR